MVFSVQKVILKKKFAMLKYALNGTIGRDGEVVAHHAVQVWRSEPELVTLMMKKESSVLVIINKQDHVFKG